MNDHKKAIEEAKKAQDATTLRPVSKVHVTPVKPAPDMPEEVGGREGPEPTRYGDWETGGRCSDF